MALGRLAPGVSGGLLGDFGEVSRGVLGGVRRFWGCLVGCLGGCLGGIWGMSMGEH